MFDYRTLCIALVLAYSLLSCQSNSIKDNDSDILTSTAQQLYDTVGAKHDTAMLLMKPIGQCQFALRNNMQAATFDSLDKDKVLTLLLSLKKADDAMMQWMRAFKGLELEEAYYQSQTEDSIMRYLRSEELKIEAVHRQMQASIDSARAFLQK